MSRLWIGMVLTGSLMASVATATEASKQPQQVASPISSLGLIEDIYAKAENPSAYNWRQASGEFELGLGYMDESNNFDNDAYTFAYGIPSGSTIFRFGLRRVNVYGTSSSAMLGRTPFKQAASVTRYEFLAGGLIELLEGRSLSRFSGVIPDLENALFLVAGLHYSHPNQSVMIKKSDRPDPLPGQDAVNSTKVVELGLRWHLYLPQSFGLYMEWSRHLRLPVPNKLRGWSYLSVGVLWDVGVKK